MRRDSVALALELQEQSECTFTPNLRKPGPCGTPPAEARLNLSAEVSWSCAMCAGCICLTLMSHHTVLASCALL
jgi:hypothetical protein